MKQKLLNKFWLRVGMIVAVMTTALAGTVMAQATTYSSNVTLPVNGVNVSSCKVKISGTENGSDGNGWEGTKLGKSGSGASANVTIPAGTTTLYVHCAAWKGKSSTLTLSTTASGVTITPSTEWSLTSDDGINNSSPFALNNYNKASTDYFKEYTLTGVNSDITVKFEAKNERAVFWGVNAVTGSGSSAVATSTTINVPSNFNTDIYQGTSAGTLTATVAAGETTITINSAIVCRGCNTKTVETLL